MPAFRLLACWALPGPIRHPQSLAHACLLPSKQVAHCPPPAPSTTPPAGKLEKKEHILNERDALFVDLRHKHFAAASNVTCLDRAGRCAQCTAAGVRGAPVQLHACLRSCLPRCALTVPPRMLALQAIANLMDEFKAKNRVGKVRKAWPARLGGLAGFGGPFCWLMQCPSLLGGPCVAYWCACRP